MKTMFKVKVCLLMLLCSVAAAMANPPVPVEKVKGTIKNAERRTRYRSYYY